MKVLVVHNAYQSHHVGGEDVVVKLEIAALKGEIGKQNVFEYIVSNDNIHRLKLLFTLWGNKAHFKAIYQLVKQNEINIVHVHNFFPLLTPLIFKAAKLGGAKVVHTLHNFRWWCLAGIWYRKEQGNCEKCVAKKFTWPAVYHRCYRSSFIQSFIGSLAFYWYSLKKYQQYIDTYFVLSAFQQEKIKHLISPCKIKRKPNSICIPSVLKAWQNKKNYLFVGRLEAAKGVDLLLSTWQQLPKHFRLTLIGVGDFHSFEKKYTQENIQFLGKLSHDETLVYMEQAKYLLQSSLAYETFSLATVEALARGTPVIAINRGTRVEFIQHRLNGFLCEPEELKDTILKANDYPDYELLSHQAYQSAKQFCTRVVTRTQVEYYKALLHE